MFSLGGETAGVHNLMPFLLIGIGVDDMFVIANAVDQVPFSKSPNERLIMAMRHAGPSITITSFTNALAFLFGSTTSLIALKSFCQFAAVSIIMLYVTVVLIFTPAMAWDTRRINAKRGDCCGLCCCAEDTWICCFGYFLSDKQKAFSHQKPKPKPDEKKVAPADTPESKTEQKEDDIEFKIDSSVKDSKDKDQSKEGNSK